MSQDTGRKVDFRIDLFKRPEYRRVRKRHPMSLEWLMLLVAIAREALDNGRICAGGTPLSRDDIADEIGLDDAGWLVEAGFGNPQEWLDACLSTGLLAQDSDGAFRVPNWPTWYKTRFDQEAACGLPAEFFEKWANAAGERFVSASELCSIAQSVGIETTARSIAKLITVSLSTVNQKFTLEKSKDRTNASLYRLVANQEASSIKVAGSAGSAGNCRQHQPTTYNLQPTTSNLQPTTYHQQPTTSNLPPATRAREIETCSVSAGETGVNAYVYSEDESGSLSIEEIEQLLLLQEQVEQ